VASGAVNAPAICDSRVSRFGSEARQRRERTQRKSQLKLLRTETEEFAASVERDLDQLPTIEETDRKR